jgi:hypothetical protein
MTDGQNSKVGPIIIGGKYKNGTNCASETKDKFSPHNVQKKAGHIYCM